MSDKEITRLAHDLFNIIKQIPSLRPEVGAADGFTRSEYELLAFIAINQSDEKRLFSSTEISKLLGITPAAVTHMINPLEKAACVERMQDENDRRLVLIRLTKKGNKIAELIIENFKEKLSAFIEYLGEEDSQTFILLMNKLLKYFSTVNKTVEL